MEFHCNKNQKHHNVECHKDHKHHRQVCHPEVECLKVKSVICTKTVQKVAELTVDAGDYFGVSPELAPDTQYSVIPNPAGIVMRGTLINGKVINSGYVPVTVTAMGPAGVNDNPVILNLPFQEETECPGACAGDDLQETQPIVEGIIPPVFTPNINTNAANADLGTLTVKVIIKTQITVSREKLVYSTVNVIGDINPNRCDNGQTTQATTQQFFG